MTIRVSLDQLRQEARYWLDDEWRTPDDLRRGLRLPDR